MNSFFLDCFNFKSIHFLIKDLTHIHNNGFVNLLPQVGAEDLNQRNFERRNFAVHEDSGEVELDLEADVDVGTVDRGRPPESEPPVRNLVQTGALRIGQLFVLHRLLEAGRLFPKQTFPRREIRALEQRVLQNTLHATECLGQGSKSLVCIV